MDRLEEIGHRLAEFIKLKRIGVNELGRMTGTSGAQISNILKGKKYGIDKLLVILDYFPELNCYWLLNGSGDMIHDGTGLTTEESKQFGDLKVENARSKGEVEELRRQLESIHKDFQEKIDLLNNTVYLQNKTINALERVANINIPQTNGNGKH